DWFYRTATDFRWDMHAPVSDGETLYARYTFSYRSNLPEAKGARVMFEGVSIMTLRDGQIAEYHEVANTAPAFVDMNFAPERIAKIVAKQGAALKARPEMARHLKDGQLRHFGARAARARNPYSRWWLWISEPAPCGAFRNDEVVRASRLRRRHVRHRFALRKRCDGGSSDRALF